MCFQTRRSGDRHGATKVGLYVQCSYSAVASVGVGLAVWFRD